MGTGASTDCFTNAAFGGDDAFTPDGHFAHALVILDGKCAKTAGSLPDLKYRLVRVLGQVFGLGWSQLNLNVITNSPPPTTDDRAGLPAMHAQDLPSCVPISARDFTGCRYTLLRAGFGKSTTSVVPHRPERSGFRR
jgi:hypothetical protein